MKRKERLVVVRELIGAYNDGMISEDTLLNLCVVLYDNRAGAV